MVITNGFSYIAFLMFVAGGLLALEKYAKWKVFNVVQIFQMFFSILKIFIHKFSSDL